MPETPPVAVANPQSTVLGTDNTTRPPQRRRGGASNPRRAAQDRAEGATSGVISDPDSNARGARRPGKPRAQGDINGRSGEPSTHTNSHAMPGRQRSGQNGGRGGPRDGTIEQGSSRDGGPARPRQPRNRTQGGAAARSPRSHTPGEASVNGSPIVTREDDMSTQNKRPRRNRGRNFGGELTEGAQGDSAGQNVPSSERYRSAAPKKDDLTSRLVHELSTPPYPDCLICFAPITPMQQTWSCSPSHPTLAASDDENGVSSGAPGASTGTQSCWMTFHLKCLRAWAAKSVKDVAEAWRARGEEREGDWRCPGCQSKRTAVPSSYWCFCGSTPDPKPPRLATPHSCANPCSRPRACGHPCSLNCHPGPCPPCQVTTQIPCYCGKETLSFRCANLAIGRNGIAATAELSCNQTCGRMLGCGNHTCEDACHSGRCKLCSVRVMARCYCGKEEKEIGCGEGEEKNCTVLQDGKEERWVGQFACESICARSFDCGIHRCSKSCHPPSPIPVSCPRSPSVVTHCPCGKHALTPNSAPFFPSGTLLTRTSCTDPVPTCASTCMKPLEGCEHVCSSPCHTGPCPPCSIVIVRPCRCGSSTLEVRCFEDRARALARARGETGPEVEILCERPCGALRACGRHQCNRPCCPLASLAGLTKGKGKKQARMDALPIVDEQGWHECDLVCGKPLSCGNHHCEERDHKGPCPPCLRSSFEEMVCYCGRTVLDPPIPCGTRIACTYPCSRPPPTCGHPKMPHLCHEDPNPCPPCRILVTKECACGKKMVGNVPCSREREKVTCGTVCGKLLACGFHHCERLCHGDACGPCHAPCGKPRRFCLPAMHPCTLACHAPASCNESEPCRSVVTITCPCGRISQSIACGRSMTNPAGRENSQQPKCTNECAIAKRNARLADALRINPERTGSRLNQVTYNEDLVMFARANAKFCAIVEKSFSDLLASEKKSQILPHMPEQKRKFVHDLAAVYRMDARMVDQEPHRSVQLLRRIDSRIPSPLLSASVAPASTASTGLGKLADLRGPGLQPLSRPGSARTSATPSPAPAPSSSGIGAGRGWTSVAVRPPVQPASSSWGPSPTLTARGVPTPPRATPSPGPVRTAAATPVPVVPSTVNVNAEDVPDNWEDEV
ncbi:hypothetical protein BC628DRAFT_1319106 [Trametes gibbosa]|nr:hypothetical protein BC628DRAFT_1319106 [Trametes gibbosa]